MRYFNYEKIAREAGISSDKLKRLVDLFTDEEPHDAMLAELHTMRACMAIKAGRLTVDEALAEAEALVA